MAIAEWRQKLKTGEVSSLELVNDQINRIRSIDDKLHSYLLIDEDNAKKTAKKIDLARSTGQELPPLAGIPFAIKDNFCTKDIPTTCSSRMLKDFVPPYESTVTEKLWSAGGILIGKTNLDEFAMGSATDTSYFGNTINPLSKDNV